MNRRELLKALPCVGLIGLPEAKAQTIKPDELQGGQIYKCEDGYILIEKVCEDFILATHWMQITPELYHSIHCHGPKPGEWCATWGSDVYHMEKVELNLTQKHWIYVGRIQDMFK